jgi:hypothetical protein
MPLGPAWMHITIIPQDQGCLIRARLQYMQLYAGVSVDKKRQPV